MFRNYTLLLLVPLVTACQDSKIREALNQGLKDGLYDPNNSCITIQKATEIDPTLIKIILNNLKEEKKSLIIQDTLLLCELDETEENSLRRIKARFNFIDDDSSYTKEYSLINTPIGTDYVSVPTKSRKCLHLKESAPVFITSNNVAERINIPIYSNTLLYKVYQDDLKIENKDIYDLINSKNPLIFSNESTIRIALTKDEKQELVNYGKYKTLANVPNSINYKFLGVYYNDKPQINDTAKFINNDDTSMKINLCFYKRTLVQLKDFLSINLNQKTISNQKAVQAYFTYKFNYPSWIINSNIFLSQVGSINKEYSAKTILIKTDNGYRDINQM